MRKYLNVVLAWTAVMLLAAVMANAQSVSRAFYKVYAANYGALNGDTLTNVVAKMGARDSYVVIDGGRWDVDRNVTFPTNLHLVFAADSYFDISNGVSATVNGGIQAGYFTIFRGSGIVTGAPKADYWNPIWDQSKGGTGVFFASTASDIMKVVTNTTTIVYAGGTTQSFYYAEVQDSLTIATNLTVSGSLTLGGVSQASWPSFDTNVAPVGSIFMMACSNVPSGFLECDGTLYETNSVYSNLFFAISTNWGCDFDVNPGQFRVPELRGYFTRGWDHGAGNDLDSDSRFAINDNGAIGDSVGSRQRQALLGHRHYVSGSTVDSNSGNYPYFQSSGTGNQTLSGTAVRDNGGTWAPNISTNENRPRNAAVMYVIKY